MSTGPTGDRGEGARRVQPLGPRSTPPPAAVAYTDGSCLGNPGPGGWGVHAELPDGTVLELGGGELEATNNRMELRAAIEAARLTARCPAVSIVTDSSYVRSGITSWLPGWRRNGWKTATGKPVENQALWRELATLADDRITWQWTRGHAGTPGNERCDQIARWFASGIAQLGHARRTRTAQPSGRGVNSPAPGTHYLSLVDGIVARHAAWADCERRVHGVRGARFKKVRNPDEERATIAAWGLPPDALEYI